jgi:hypothetical protein
VGRPQPSYIVSWAGDTVESYSRATDEIQFSGTDETAIIQQTLEAAGDFESVYLLGDFEIATRLAIPSKTTLLIDGILTQAPQNGDGILGNENPRRATDVDAISAVGRSIGDRDITVRVLNGYLDGNRNDVTEQAQHTHTANFAGVRHLRLNGLTIRRQVDWGLRMDTCADIAVQDFSVRSEGSGGPHSAHRDGMHFIDCHDAYVDGISGRTGDDLLAIGADFRNVRNITVTNLVGGSINANGIRIHQSTNAARENRDLTVENIQIRSAMIEETGVNGIVLANSSENATFRNISIDATIVGAGQADSHWSPEDRPIRAGLLASWTDGVWENLDLDLHVTDSWGPSIAWSPDSIVRNSTIRAHVEKPGDVSNDVPENGIKQGGTNVSIGHLEDSRLELVATIENDRFDHLGPNVLIRRGRNVDVSGTVAGGTVGVQLGDPSLDGGTVSGGRVHDTTFLDQNGSGVVESTGSGPCQIVDCTFDGVPESVDTDHDRTAVDGTLSLE